MVIDKNYIYLKLLGLNRTLTVSIYAIVPYRLNNYQPGENQGSDYATFIPA